MTLAMDIQMHIEKEKENLRTEFFAERKAEGKEEERREIALRFVQDGIPVEQVAKCTGLSVEEVQGLCIKQ